MVTNQVVSQVQMPTGHGHFLAVTHVLRAAIGFLIAVTVVATLFLAFISMRASADAGGPQFLGRHFLVVRSGSMAPAFATGSMVAINQTTRGESTDLPTGTVVAFTSLANPEILITHRIVDRVNVNGIRMYQTKGDANATVDGTYLEPDRIIGTYSFSVPRLGFFMVALQGRQFLLTLTAAFTLASISMMLTKRAATLVNQKEIQQ